MSTEPNSGARITVRAQTPIVAGQEVTVHYISFMYGHFRSVLHKHDKLSSHLATLIF